MEKLKEYTKILIQKSTNTNFAINENDFELPPENNGDLALPCFKFAKILKKSPIAIAEELVNSIKDANLEKIQNVNGYLNFFYKNEFVCNLLLNDFDNNQISQLRKDNAGKRILIEHTSINPNASPHVGRARNALIGDCLVRMFRYLGFQTEAHYFVNDVGKQIALLVYATQNLQNYTFESLLQIYIDANEKLKEQPEIEQVVFDLLSRFENNEPEIVAKFNKIVKTCLDGQQALFSELNIHYDFFDYESKYIHEHTTDKVLEKLKTVPEIFTDEEGRLVLNQKGKDIGIEEPYLVLTRGNGTSLYCLRDICYSIYKSEQNADRNIILLGEDQKVYFQQIAEALKSIGITPPESVHYSFVLLPEGKMSTRKGTVVLLSDFMRECYEKMNEKLLEKNGVADNDKAKIMGYGVLKYAILKCSPEKNVLFDWQNATNFNGDSSLFIQYNYARIQSLINKANIKLDANIDFSLLAKKEEKTLAKQLSLWNNTILLMFKSLNPSLVCNYAYHLTQIFSQFYTNISILNEIDPKTKIARLKLCELTANTIKDCLSILGIDIVNEM